MARGSHWAPSQALCWLPGWMLPKLAPSTPVPAPDDPGRLDFRPRYFSQLLPSTGTLASSVGNCVTGGSLFPSPCRCATHTSQEEEGKNFWCLREEFLPEESTNCHHMHMRVHIFKHMYVFAHVHKVGGTYNLKKGRNNNNADNNHIG